MHVEKDSYDTDPDKGLIETDYVCGCALFAPVKIFKDIGMLDERFFLTYEDTDLCYRARKEGYKLFIDSHAKIWHKVSTSFGGENSVKFNYYMARNFLLWAEKHLNGAKFIAVFKKVLLDIFKLSMPYGFDFNKIKLLNIIYNDHPSDRYYNYIRKIYSNPLIVAKIKGIIDYSLRRFGCMH